jgi:hypothetical protein
MAKQFHLLTIFRKEKVMVIDCVKGNFMERFLVTPVTCRRTPKYLKKIGTPCPK